MSSTHIVFASDIAISAAIPDSIAYIRSASSTLKYSDLGTARRKGAPIFEEHYDGEIYMSTMWDIREMLNRMYPQNTTLQTPRRSDGQCPSKPITKGTNIFERDFLGSMYVLGTTSPDTMVKSRDAMIVADQMLYPSDATDSTAPGKHRALIEQLFAAKELGVNAREVLGGKATISTQVTPFAGDQPAPTVPPNVKAAPASATLVKVTWDAVPGAISYEILKRKAASRRTAVSKTAKRAFARRRLFDHRFPPRRLCRRQPALTKIKARSARCSAPAGLNNLFDSEYVVRAIGVNSTGQVGFSTSPALRSHAASART